MYGGFAGKVLHVHLGTQDVRAVPLREERALLLGGRALGSRLLYEETVPQVDPLGEQNPLIFVTGPVNGTLVPLAAKCVLVTKSPATGAYCDCTVGGFLASAIKYAGYDAVVIKDKCPEPSVLVITDDRVEFMPARDLWGLGAWEAEKKIKERLGIRYQVAVIGPAGERLSPLANISHDLYRQAGRGGLGAVMGSKNLKAVAVSGTKPVHVAKPARFEDACGKLFQRLRDLRLGGDAWTDSLVRFGTTMFTDVLNEQGMLPTRNFSDGRFDSIDCISGQAMRERIFVRNRGCQACTVACGKFVRVESGPYAGAVVGPEYETIFALGSNCGVSSIEAIARANQLCDDLGLDTISTGVTIAFAMECYERGLVTKADLAGLDLRFGDAEAMLEAIRLMGLRQGVGYLLSQGVKRLAQAWDIPEAYAFAMHVKGLEMPGYEPRATAGMALAYAISDRGACHLRAWTPRLEVYGDLPPLATEGKAEAAAVLEQRKLVMDSLVICDMMGVVPEHAEAVSALTGMVVTPVVNARWPSLMEEFIVRIGNRTSHVAKKHTMTARAFNVREGFTRKDDTLPERVFCDPLESGPAAGHRLSQNGFEQMLSDFYRLRGWDEEGRPLRARAEELGLAELLADVVV
ncbi:MAG: aldehyde ferredoxin oxidoreductase family protein [Bacillota bacterium]|nr:aldehyde ferredoxin oxidoreductase family protein [Bacillota bacterium]